MSKENLGVSEKVESFKATGHCRQSFWRRKWKRVIKKRVGENEKKRRKKNQSLRKESSRGKCPRHLPWCDRQWTYVLRIQSHNCHRNINITLLSDHIRLWQRSTTIVFAYNKKNRQAKRYSMCQCSAPPRFPFCCSKCHVYHKDAKHATPRTKEWIKKTLQKCN